jgi:hypothetical protein
VRALRNELSEGGESAFLMMRIGSTGNLKQTTKQSSSKPSSKTQANNQAKPLPKACHPKASPPPCLTPFHLCIYDLTSLQK